MMPHKNDRCNKCGDKTKHHKWLNFVSWGSYGSELWIHEIKCVDCGHIQRERKARWGKGTKTYDIEHDGEKP